jgi:hypothetical protein
LPGTDGQQGQQGPQGPEGPQGPKNVLPYFYATNNEIGTVILPSGSAVPFPVISYPALNIQSTAPDTIVVDNSGVYAIDVTISGITNGGGAPNQPLTIYILANGVQLPGSVYTVVSDQQGRINISKNMLMQFIDPNTSLQIIVTGATLEFINQTGFINAAIRIIGLA